MHSSESFYADDEDLMDTKPEQLKFIQEKTSILKKYNLHANPEKPKSPSLKEMQWRWTENGEELKNSDRFQAVKKISIEKS